MLGSGLVGGIVGVLLVSTGALTWGADSGWQGGAFTLLGLVVGGSSALWLENRKEWDSDR
jgi:hypothetical protein